jgi:hypothetical protein
MSLLADISWARNDELSQAELNRRAKIVSDAIESLRAFALSWEAEVAALRDVGLERINEALLPAYEQVIQLANLGSLLSATSDTEVEIGLGTKTFVLNEAQRLTFAPTPFMLAVSGGDFDRSMVGVLSSYDIETGTLVLTVTSSEGEGTYGDWRFGPFATTEDLEALRAEVAANAQTATEKAAEALVARNEAVPAATTATGALAAIQAIWYGALATAPEGAALGSQFLDTSQTPNVVKVLTEAGWAPTVTVAVGGSRQQAYTATEGQTGPFVVDGGFSVGSVNVNGAEFFDGNGVTFDAGAGEFTFAAPLTAGDLVVFRGYLANDVTDIYTKAEVDSLLSEIDPSVSVIDETLQINKGVSLAALTVEPVAGVVTLDLDESNVFRLVVDDDISITVENVLGRGRSATLMLEYDSGSLLWPAEVFFPDDGPPQFNSFAVVQIVTTPFARSDLVAEGQEVFENDGVFVVPFGVTEISAVIVGGGGGGRAGTGGGGGGEGGDLRWASSIPVTPGETLIVDVGAAGVGGDIPTQGGQTRLLRANDTLILSASGGGFGNTSTTGPSTRNGVSTPIDLAAGIGGGNGGTALPAGSTSLTGGGGGAGGYSGDGGIGGGGGATVPGGDGQGGAGGGGGASGSGSSGRGGGGGGVGLFGEGASGLGGAGRSGNPGGFGGGGGSGGTDGGVGGTGGDNGHAGIYGGGGGGADSNLSNGTHGNGGSGAARIIWGPGRQYPDPALVADVPKTLALPRLLAFPILEV